MKKILFLDVDGTLVDYENHLPKSAVEAIRRTRELGNLVFICTGRSRAEVYEDIWDIGIDGMIGGNGSYVEYQNQVVMHQKITEEECREIVDWLHERNLEFYLESNNGLFASEKFETEALPAIRAYSAQKGRDATYLTVRDVLPEMIFDGELYRDDLNKVSYVLKTYQDHTDAMARFPNLQHGTWGGVGEKALFGDMGVKNITKAHAIDVLLQYIGATKEQTIAFGDAKIDIPMLEYCSYGVAMGNGGTEIKEMADYITDAVEKDGLQKAFEKLALL